jgi:hypothetical protein
MHNRYYSPLLGHFLTPDFRAPDIYDPTTFTEPYAYAAGNPFMYWDPDGLAVYLFQNKDQQVLLDIDPELIKALMAGRSIEVYDELLKKKVSVNAIESVWTDNLSVQGYGKHNRAVEAIGKAILGSGYSFKSDSSSLVNLGVGAQYTGAAGVAGIALAEIGFVGLATNGFTSLKAYATTKSTQAYVWGTGAVTATGNFINHQYARLHNFVASKYSLLEGLFTTSAEVVTGGDLTGMPSAGDFVPSGASQVLRSSGTDLIENTAEILLDPIRRGDGLRRVIELRNKYKVGKGKNIAFAEINLTAFQGEMAAVSGRTSREGFIEVPEFRIFTSKAVGQFYRGYDSETLILEKVGQMLSPDSFGEIRLFTERPACNSCKGVINQFRERFPNINLVVTHGP